MGKHILGFVNEGSVQGRSRFLGNHAPEGHSHSHFESRPHGIFSQNPLLSNIPLDDLDKELERWGHVSYHHIVDSGIYIKSKAAGQRFMASVTQFLKSNLKLRVNREKVPEPLAMSINAW